MYCRWIKYGLEINISCCIIRGIRGGSMCIRWRILGMVECMGNRRSMGNKGNRRSMGEMEVIRIGCGKGKIWNLGNKAQIKPNKIVDLWIAMKNGVNPVQFLRNNTQERGKIWFNMKLKIGLKIWTYSWKSIFLWIMLIIDIEWDCTSIHGIMVSWYHGISGYKVMKLFIILDIGYFKYEVSTWIKQKFIIYNCCK